MLVAAQDIHPGGGPHPRRRRQRPGALRLAGFQVSPTGRFWVSPEGKFRHSSVRWQWEMLCAKLRGHYAYFGVTGNFLALSRFRHAVRLLWRKWLLRRSRRMTSKRLDDVLEHYKLPNPTIVVSLGT